MNASYATLLRTLAISLALLNMTEQAYAGPGDKGRRGPPPEAIAACENQTEGNQCEFTGRGQQLVKGVCASPPHDKAIVACKPDDGRQPPGEQDDNAE